MTDILKKIDMDKLIKAHDGDDYEVLRILSKIEFINNDFELMKKVYDKLYLFFEDITYNEKTILVRISIEKLFVITRLSNKECVKIVLKELRECLQYTNKITVTEQRLPIDSVSYCL